MHNDIQAVFIDLGNTLRILVKDEEHQSRARQQMAALVGAEEAPQTFCERLNERYKTYRKWAFETLIEAPEEELWMRWMLPDYPAEIIAPLAGELTFRRRGYWLGIISNVITRRVIPDWLEADGFSQYFKAVVLSSVFGRRKPDPSIFWEASRQIGVEPAHCAYVGDNPSRDVLAASRAGMRQLRVAESEKFAHVTFFFNGGNTQPFPGEDRVCIPSLRGIPFDQALTLRLQEITQAITEGIDQRYDLIVANFANGDVIGHTQNCFAKV
jgi:putative hydrolase of the HAD superfamily